MIHRNKDENDFHFGKFNGVGGKMENNESPLEAAIRETNEESGLVLTSEQLKSVGVVHLPLFKPKKNQDWIVYVFNAEIKQLPKFELKTNCKEGTLSWVEMKNIPKLNLWAGDYLFIDNVLASKTFFITIWYDEKQQVKQHVMY